VNTEMVARLIQVVLVPAVMVTTCAIQSGALLPRYTALNDRLRLLTRERLEILRGLGLDLKLDLSAAGALLRERLDEIDAQLPELLRRHKQQRNALTALFIAIALFLVSMIAIAAAVALAQDWAATAAMALFLGGLAAYLVCAVLTVVEIAISHRALHYEAKRVASLGQTGATNA
jgi:hypothetical protein